MDAKTITREFLQESIDTSDLRDDQDLFDSGLVNSLFAMQLVMFVEKTFGLTLTNDDLDVDNFRSLDAIAGFIAAKNGGSGGTDGA